MRGVELRETPFPGRAVFLSRCRACVSGGDHQGVVDDEGRVACRGGRDAPDDLGHPTYPRAVYVQRLPAGSTSTLMMSLLSWRLRHQSIQNSSGTSHDRPNPIVAPFRPVNDSVRLCGARSATRNDGQLHSVRRSTCHHQPRHRMRRHRLRSSRPCARPRYHPHCYQELMRGSQVLPRGSFPQDGAQVIGGNGPLPPRSRGPDLATELDARAGPPPRTVSRASRRHTAAGWPCCDDADPPPGFWAWMLTCRSELAEHDLGRGDLRPAPAVDTLPVFLVWFLRHPGPATPAWAASGSTSSSARKPPPHHRRARSSGTSPSPLSIPLAKGVAPFPAYLGCPPPCVCAGQCGEVLRQVAAMAATASTAAGKR